MEGDLVDVGKMEMGAAALFFFNDDGDVEGAVVLVIGEGMNASFLVVEVVVRFPTGKLIGGISPLVGSRLDSLTVFSSLRGSWWR